MEHIQVDAGTGRWQLWVRWRDNTTAPSHMKNNLYLRLPVDRVEATGAVLQYMEALQGDSAWTFGVTMKADGRWTLGGLLAGRGSMTPPQLAAFMNSLWAYLLQQARQCREEVVARLDDVIRTRPTEGPGTDPVPTAAVEALPVAAGFD